MSMKRRKNLPRGGVPAAWPADMRREVARWLRDQIQALATGEEKSKEMIRIADLEGLRNQLAYYRHAQGAVRWLLAKIDRAAKAANDPFEGPPDVNSSAAEAG